MVSDGPTPVGGIGRMRDELRVCRECNARPTIDAMIAFADDIEREFADRYIELPLDANGEPIHMGDIVQYGREEPYEVKEIRFLAGYEDEVGDGDRFGGLLSMSVRHYRPPTVEDVLDELTDETVKVTASYYDDVLGVDEFTDAVHELVVEYAKKLRIAGDDDGWE